MSTLLTQSLYNSFNRPSVVTIHRLDSMSWFRKTEIVDAPVRVRSALRPLPSDRLMTVHKTSTLVLLDLYGTITLIRTEQPLHGCSRVY